MAKYQINTRILMSPYFRAGDRAFPRISTSSRGTKQYEKTIGIVLPIVLFDFQWGDNVSARPLHQGKPWATQTLLMWMMSKIPNLEKNLNKTFFFKHSKRVAPMALLTLYFLKKTADQQIMTILSTYLQGLPYFSSPFFPLHIAPQTGYHRFICN